MDSLPRRGFVASVIAGFAAAIGLRGEAVAAEVWKPSKNPDPSAILNEATSDTRAGRYEVALAKHVWYHEHALEIEPAQYGVRLSFALGYWMDLAEKYPPALEKLKSVRDQAGEKVLSETGKPVFHFFHDFVSINRELNEPDQVLQLFRKLHNEAPDKAESVYRIAEPVLIGAKEFKLCGEYIDPDTDVPLIIVSFHRDRNLEARFGAEYTRSVESRMTEKSATLVALLAVNHRNEQAQSAAESLKQSWDDRAFHKAIDDALTGQVPAPAS